jgi:hypothetical protein
MNVKIGTEAARFPFWKFFSSNFLCWNVPGRKLASCELKQFIKEDNFHDLRQLHIKEDNVHDLRQLQLKKDNFHDLRQLQKKEGNFHDL